MNPDIIRLVAEHIPPNPVTWTRLAAVNRLFNQYFTSDSLWASIDPYGIKRNIFQHFSRKCAETTTACNLLRVFWEKQAYELLESALESLTDNQYIWLGYLVNSSQSMTLVGFLGFPQLLKAALLLEPRHLTTIYPFITVPEQEQEFLLAALKSKRIRAEHFCREMITEANYKTILDHFPGAVGKVITALPKLAKDDLLLRTVGLKAPECLHKFSKTIFRHLTLNQVLGVVAVNPCRVLIGQWKEYHQVVLAAAKSREFAQDFIMELVYDLDKEGRGPSYKYKTSLDYLPRKYLKDEEILKQVCLTKIKAECQENNTEFDPKVPILDLYREIARLVLCSMPAKMIAHPVYSKNKEFVFVATNLDSKLIKSIPAEWRREATIRAISAGVPEFILAEEYLWDVEIQELCLQHDWTLEQFKRRMFKHEMLLKYPLLGTIALSWPNLFKEYSEDKEFAKAAALKYGFYQLSSMSPKLQKDPEIWELVLENYSTSKYQYRLETDKILRDLPVVLYSHRLVSKIVASTGTVEKAILGFSDELAFASACADPSTYPFIPKKLRKDFEFNRRLVAASGVLFTCLGRDLLFRSTIQESIGPVKSN